ncbi:MAG: hypothetical protein CL525_00360 [Aequorivita sp.]|nr:hypothetical protein [Aequorivita sp.]
MFLEAAIEIKFDCLLPAAKIVERYNGIYYFDNDTPKYKKRKFEFRALTEFLKIPRLSHGSKEARTLARCDFYNRWGFLTDYNVYTTASENEATFDKWHMELCELNEKRLNGELKDADEIKFTKPGFINWTVRAYENTNLALPIFNPTNLSSALYLSWFFGARELAGMKTCKRFAIDGSKSGCSVFFKPTRKDQEYCGKPCAKDFYEKRRPTRRRK